MKCSWRRMLRFYNDIFGFVSPIFRCFVRSILIFTARKRSLRRLCFHRCLSVHGGGLYGGSLSSVVSVQGRGLCLREGSLSKGGVSVRGGLCPGGPGGSLSRGEVSVQGRGLCPGEGSLSRGGVSVSETPRTVTCGWYASYWNAFLLIEELQMLS